MNNNKYSKMADDIKKTVEDSIKSTDFNKIGKEIGDTVNNVLEDAFEEARKVMDSAQQSKRAKSQEDNVKSQTIYIRSSKGGRHHKKTNSTTTEGFKHVPVGNVSSILFLVFGSIGIGVFGIGALILGILGVGAKLFSILSALLFVSIIIEFEGSHSRKRIKRYRKYLIIFNKRNSCSLREMALFTDYTEKFLYKDLKKMIAIGMFPDAKFDDEKKVIMLTREKYEQYLQQQAEINEQLNRSSGDSAAVKAEKEITPEELNNVNAILNSGNLYVKEINYAKLAISDEVVAEKVQKTEIIIMKILEYIEKKPEKIGELRRFSQYYLPETVKLLNTYKELEAQPIQGVNISTAKGEIANAIDSINAALAKLYDSLYEGEMLGISADISVLNTVFTQEGLKDDKFERKN